MNKIKYFITIGIHIIALFMFFYLIIKPFIIIEYTPNFYYLLIMAVGLYYVFFFEYNFNLMKEIWL